MYKLIRSIEKFEIGEGYTAEIGYIYESLTRHLDMLDKNGNKISTLSDFIELLYTVEPINWFSKTINKRGKVNHIWKDDLIEEYIDLMNTPLILEDGCLTTEALDFIDNYYYVDKNSDEIEQANMRTIIELLRKTDDRDSQFIYSYIRNNVVAINGEINLKTKRPVHSIKDEYQYIEFKNEFIKPKYKNKYDIIYEKVDNLFEKIDGPYTLVYCAYCGSKMYKFKEDYVCIGRSICKNNLNPGEEQAIFKHIPIGESVYIPKRGVSRYNVIPGIDELYLLRSLESRFGKYDFVVIESYPGKDSEGDIKITIGKKEIVIDVKSWRKSRALIEHIKDNMTQFENKDFIYVPIHLKNEYEKKLSNLNDTMKSLNLKTKVVSIGSLERLIKKEVEKYIENPSEYNCDNTTITNSKEETFQMTLI